MPAIFKKLGISFSYPENWELDEADALEGARSVTVNSPGGGAFWTVSVHSRITDPAKLAKAAVKALREEYDSLEAQPIRENVAGWELLGYDFNFYCFDLTSTAAVRSVRTKWATYTVYYQAEDRELAEIEDVLQAMTLSVLASLKK